MNWLNKIIEFFVGVPAKIDSIENKVKWEVREVVNIVEDEIASNIKSMNETANRIEESLDVLIDKKKKKAKEAYEKVEALVHKDTKKPRKKGS